MTRILYDFRERLDLRQVVISRLRYQAADGKRPCIKVDFRIEHVIEVVRKLFQWCYLAIRKGLRQMLSAKRELRCAITELKSSLQNGFTELGNQNCRRREHGRHPEQLTP